MLPEMQNAKIIKSFWNSKGLSLFVEFKDKNVIEIPLDNEKALRVLEAFGVNSSQELIGCWCCVLKPSTEYLTIYQYFGPISEE